MVGRAIVDSRSFESESNEMNTLYCFFSVSQFYLFLVDIYIYGNQVYFFVWTLTIIIINESVGDWNNWISGMGLSIPDFSLWTLLFNRAIEIQYFFYIFLELKRFESNAFKIHLFHFQFD